MQIQVVESLSFRLRSSATPHLVHHSMASLVTHVMLLRPFGLKDFPWAPLASWKAVRLSSAADWCRLNCEAMTAQVALGATFLCDQEQNLFTHRKLHKALNLLEQFDKHQSFTPSSKILCRLRSKEHVAKRLCFKPGRNANEGLVISHLPKWKFTDLRAVIPNKATLPHFNQIWCHASVRAREVKEERS